MRRPPHRLPFSRATGDNTRAPSRARRAGGFSLVELMVASAVLSISLLGMAQLLAMAVQLGQFARNNTVAVQIATGKLSELKSGYHYGLASNSELPDLAPGEHGPTTVTLPAPTDVQEAASYSVSWVISAAGASRKDVTVSVRPLELTVSGKDTSRSGKPISMYARFTP